MPDFTDPAYMSRIEDRPVGDWLDNQFVSPDFVNDDWLSGQFTSPTFVDDGSFNDWLGSSAPLDFTDPQYMTPISERPEYDPKTPWWETALKVGSGIAGAVLGSVQVGSGGGVPGGSVGGTKVVQTKAATNYTPLIAAGLGLAALVLMTGGNRR